MESGELCVLLDSIKQLQTPYVDNLDTVQLPSPALVTGNVIIILYMYALCGVPQLLGQFVKCSCYALYEFGNIMHCHKTTGLIT